MVKAVQILAQSPQLSEKSSVHRINIPVPRREVHGPKNNTLIMHQFFLSTACSLTNLLTLQCSTTKWFVLHRMKEGYMLYNKHINTNDFKFLQKE